MNGCRGVAHLLISHPGSSANQPELREISHDERSRRNLSLADHESLELLIREADAACAIRVQRHTTASLEGSLPHAVGRIFRTATPLVSNLSFGL
jgi:hypothetical protein